MSKLSDLVKEIPEMLSGDELIESLIVLPEYDVSVLYDSIQTYVYGKTIPYISFNSSSNFFYMIVSEQTSK